MNNLDNAYKEVSSIGQYSRKYFLYLSEVLESIDVNEINKLEDVFESARANGNTIFVAGNGGSAATATTMANDIGFDIIKKTGTNKPFRVFSLVDNNSVITAISNDVGYEKIFINQLKIHYYPLHLHVLEITYRVQHIHFVNPLQHQNSLSLY